MLREFDSSRPPSAAPDLVQVFDDLSLPMNTCVADSHKVEDEDFDDYDFDDDFYDDFEEDFDDDFDEDDDLDDEDDDDDEESEEEESDEEE